MTQLLVTPRAERPLRDEVRLVCNNCIGFKRSFCSGAQSGSVLMHEGRYSGVRVYTLEKYARVTLGKNTLEDPWS